MQAFLLCGNTMSSFDCDLFVIGAGSGGVRAARMAAQRGARVTVAEAGALGGTCVNLGCIPKKLYSHAAHYGELFEQSRGFGWRFGDTVPTLDWARLKSQRAAEITRLNGIYDQLLRQAGVTVMRGHARLVDPHTVGVQARGGELRTVTARHILLATGGRPRPAAGPGAEWALDSDAMFDLDPFPRRLVVVGGGYIACEFASIFHGLGAEVTLVHRRPGILRGFDAEVAAFATAEMRKKGVAMRLDTTVDAVRRRPDGSQALSLSDGRVLEADAVLQAIGRDPASDGLGLEALGIRPGDDGSVPVNDRFETVVPSVHAIGDLVGAKALTPVALAEAMVLVDQLFGDGRRAAIDYETIPTAVFTHPNIGTVGLSEEAARERVGGLRIFRSEFRALRHTLSGSTERTLMKIVVDAATDRVLGMHMVGEDAGEVIQGFAVAVLAGLTKGMLDRTLGIHPTVAEEFVTMRDPA
jgi:glutathione reductase (NADPH)